MLNIIHNIPERLLDCDATELHDVLGGPTLLHVSGRRQPALFISVLLHGNETSGFYAVQRLLKKYHEHTLPRDLSIFIGNVSAARHAQRRLDSQPDYNRIWPGGIVADTPEHRMVQQVFDIMRERGVFVSIDLHNNTGLNPHYACVNRLDHPFLHLATLFSRTVVYFIKPTGVQSLAFAELAPSATVECGQVNNPASIDHAYEFVEACSKLSALPGHPISEHDLDLFHTVATIKIPEQYTIGFDDQASDICFTPDLDHLNFRELPSGTLLGHLGPGVEAPFDCRDEQGREVSERFFTFTDREILSKRPFMPSMLTLDKEVIRQDCLCYLMERISINYPEPPQQR